MIQKAKVTRRFHFNSAHHLPGYNGKCSQIHGHGWILEVTLEGRISDNGFVVDFSKLKKTVTEEIIEQLDHNDLNFYIKNPTAENLCIWIWERLQNTYGGVLKKIRLYESPDSWVDFNGGI